MPYQEIIYKFIAQYRSRDNILGIIFYGSSNYRTNTLQSDIDLLIITDGEYNYKGVTYIDGKKIEYFEKNFYYLMNEIENLVSSLDRSLLSIFMNGTIIYNKDKTVNFLKEEVLINQTFHFQKKKKHYQESDLLEFYEYIQQLEPCHNFFSYIYYNLLELMRKKYHEENGYSKLPSLKVYQLYSNPEYAKKFYCSILPNEHFMNLYLDLFIYGYTKEKFDVLCNMIHIDDNYQQTSFYNRSKNEQKYISTIVKNMFDRTIEYLEKNDISCNSCYYITLEKIRKLYCYIHQLDTNINLINEYDSEFLELFDLCINDKDRVNNLNNLFNYVVNSLQMNYRHYKILELH